MPRMKASKGAVRLVTPFPEEFQRMLFYELRNDAQWNPSVTQMYPSANSWRCVSGEGKPWGWVIRWNARTREILVECKVPKVHIRKGMYILMGQARLVIEGEPVEPPREGTLP
jgi:hypothetical protein